MERDPATVLDELLVLEAKAGSAAAFRQLVLRWTPGLLRHARQMLRGSERADDVVQDAWVGIASGLRRLDDPAKFPAWAYAIATRRCVDVIRRSARDHRVRAAVGEAEPDRARVSEEERLDLAAAVRRLPIDQRLVVSLHYGEGLGVEDIATTHRLPVGTIKSRLHVARRTLRTLLEGA